MRLTSTDDTIIVVHLNTEAYVREKDMHHSCTYCGYDVHFQALLPLPTSPTTPCSSPVGVPTTSMLPDMPIGVMKVIAGNQCFILPLHSLPLSPPHYPAPSFLPTLPSPPFPFPTAAAEEGLPPSGLSMRSAPSSHLSHHSLFLPTTSMLSDMPNTIQRRLIDGTDIDRLPAPLHWVPPPHPAEDSSAGKREGEEGGEGGEEGVKGEDERAKYIAAVQEAEGRGGGEGRGEGEGEGGEGSIDTAAATQADSAAATAATSALTTGAAAGAGEASAVDSAAASGVGESEASSVPAVVRAEPVVAGPVVSVAR